MAIGSIDPSDKCNKMFIISPFTWRVTKFNPLLWPADSLCSLLGHSTRLDWTGAGHTPSPKYKLCIGLPANCCWHFERLKQGFLIRKLVKLGPWQMGKRQTFDAAIPENCPDLNSPLPGPCYVVVVLSLTPKGLLHSNRYYNNVPVSICPSALFAFPALSNNPSTFKRAMLHQISITTVRTRDCWPGCQSRVKGTWRPRMLDFNLIPLHLDLVSCWWWWLVQEQQWHINLQFILLTRF